MSNIIEVFQPPQKGYHCSVCGIKICRASVNKSGLCRKCNARRLGQKNGGQNKGKKSR